MVKERTLEFAQQHPETTDADNDNALGSRHQQANQEARQLVRAGELRRTEAKATLDTPGSLLKFWSGKPCPSSLETYRRA